MFERLWTAISERLFGEQRAEAEGLRDRARAAAPVVWLLGKTGAGKTSIVAALTGDAAAEIGAGFRPCTRRAGFYDLPPEAPVLRFLDTRGLEEPGYDPAEDIAWCGGQAHLLLVVARVDDPDQGAVLDAVRAARREHPEWPIVVAQTHLHAGYALGEGHPEPYPYTGGPEDEANPAIPAKLRLALRHQRDLFDGLPGEAPRFVPLDLTHPDDGFAPVDFGAAALVAALSDAAPEAWRAIERSRLAAAGDPLRASCETLIRSYAGLVAGAGATPVPVLGIGGLASGNAVMLGALARRYGVAWTATDIAAFAGAIGSGALLAFALRYATQEVVKLVPGFGTILGGTINAVAAFGLTYGIGAAACHWLWYRQRGRTAPTEEIRAAFRDALASGAARARQAA